MNESQTIAPIIIETPSKKPLIVIETPSIKSPFFAPWMNETASSKWSPTLAPIITDTPYTKPLVIIDTPSMKSRKTAD